MAQAPSGDTIVAVATAAGRGSQALIRLSGPAAFERVAALDVSGGEALRQSPGFRAVPLALESAHGVVPVTAVVYRAPRSYTREDVVELLVPGSPALLAGLVEAILAAGGEVRPAGPGEFTMRAFLGGRLDLSQAEAVAQLIHARGEEEATASRRALRGELGERVGELREALVEVLALLEAALDFPDEQLPEVSPEGISRRLGGIDEQLALLRSSARLRGAGSDALRVVLAGFPNAGKSSLFNVLAGRPAAISSAVAGTTRDPLRVVRTYDGRRVEWIDLAGMETLPGIGDSSVGERSVREEGAEEEGASRASVFGAEATDAAIWEVVARLTRLELESADCVLWVVDPTADLERSLAQYRRLPAATRLLVVQKMDLLEGETLTRRAAVPSETIYVSAHRGSGVEGLLRGVLRSGPSDTSLPAPVGDDAAAPRFLLTSHQQAALSLAGEALGRASLSVSEGMGYEYAASDLRDVLSALEQLLGRVTPDIVLAHVFARFCVGK